MERSVERIIAVDWSGKRENESEFIWTAVMENGRLTELENGRSRGETIKRVIEEADAARGRVVVGLDFAFSFPRWYCEERLHARDVRDVWNAVRRSETRGSRHASPRSGVEPVAPAISEARNRSAGRSGRRPRAPSPYSRSAGRARSEPVPFAECRFSPT